MYDDSVSMPSAKSPMLSGLDIDGVYVNLPIMDETAKVKVSPL